MGQKNRRFAGLLTNREATAYPIASLSAAILYRCHPAALVERRSTERWPGAQAALLPKSGAIITACDDH